MSDNDEWISVPFAIRFTPGMIHVRLTITGGYDTITLHLSGETRRYFHQYVMPRIQQYFDVLQTSINVASRQDSVRTDDTKTALNIAQQEIIDAVNALVSNHPESISDYPNIG